MKLSIITINRNNAYGLTQTLASVAVQIFKDFEHIVIDGASTDNSVEIIKKFPHITYSVSEPDVGIYDAMNKGIKQAKGEYCLFLNSGDCLSSSSILSEIFAVSYVEDIIYGNVIWKFENGDMLDIEKPSKISLFFFTQSNFSHQSSFIKMELLVKLNGYRTDLQIVSDWAFFINAIFKHGATCKYIPTNISIYMKNGISSNLENFAKIQEEKELVWKELFPYTYKDIMHYAELEIELKRVYKIPGVKFIMKYIYPLYRKIKSKF